MRPYPVAASALAVLALVAAVAGPAKARDTTAEEQYRRHRALCMSGQLNQDQATCLRDAGAGLHASRQGNADPASTDYERNRLSRCSLQPVGEREMCVRRMNGEGVVRGSVDGGGFYREYREVQITIPDAGSPSSTR